VDEPEDPVTLTNGLRLVLIDRSEFESVALVAVVLAGSRCDPPKLPGLAHVTEHALLHPGKPDDPSSAVGALLARGAAINGSTDIWRAEFAIVAHHWDTEPAVDAMASILREPPSDLGRLAVERNLVAEELMLTGEGRGNTISNIMLRAMFVNPELQRGPQGTLRAVRRIGLEDVRAFHSKWYRAEGIVLCAAGRFDRNALLDVVAARFGDLPGGAPQPERVVPGGRTGRVVFAPPPGHEPVGALAWCFQVEDAPHPDQVYCRLLASAFCDESYSRVAKAIAWERGLAYFVDGGLYRAPGFTALTLSCVSRRRNLRPLVDRVVHEAARLAAEGMQEDEFVAVRERCAREALLVLDHPYPIAAWYSAQESLGESDRTTVRGFARRLRAADRHTLNELARRVLSPANCTVCVVDSAGLLARHRIRRVMRRHLRRARNA
jgi:predicted Zn-dependent peptidase